MRIIKCVGGGKRERSRCDGCPINERKTSRMSIIIFDRSRRKEAMEAGLEGQCEGGGT